jgi:hypothetical protein
MTKNNEKHDFLEQKTRHKEKIMFFQKASQNYGLIKF